MPLPQVLNYIQQFTSAEQTFLQGLADISYSQGDILYFNGAILTRLPAGTSGNFLKTQGAGANPIWAAASASLTVGTTTITSGTTTRILYDNAGVLGEYTLSGSGTVVAMATSPSFTTPTLGVALATSINGNAFTTGTGTLNLSTFTLTVAGTASVSGTNTGDQTNISGNAATVTTNANLTGAITSSGNATSLGSFSSANLSGALTDETGSGSAVFGTNPTIAKPVMNARNQTAQTYSPAGAATATLDLSLGDQHYITMPAGNITIALSNDTNNQIFYVSILQDGTGSRTVTWFTTIKWAGGTPPVLTTTASKRDAFIFVRTGSGTYDGFVVGQNI